MKGPQDACVIAWEPVSRFSAKRLDAFVERALNELQNDPGRFAGLFEVAG